MLEYRLAYSKVMHRRAHEIANNMLSENMDSKMISRITGLSLEEIKKF